MPTEPSPWQPSSYLNCVNYSITKLAKINKDELIDNILASKGGDEEFQKISRRLEEVMEEMLALKAAVVSPYSLINKITLN